MMLSPISHIDEALLEHCRRLVWAIVADAYDERTADHIDLHVLQRLIDDRICEPDDDWGLQSLGVRLGDILCDAGFHWAVDTYETRRDLVVAWKSSGLAVSAPVLIQKRVEDGEECDIAALFEWACGLAEAKESE